MPYSSNFTKLYIERLCSFMLCYQTVLQKTANETTLWLMTDVCKKAERNNRKLL